MSGSRSCADWIRVMCFMEQVMCFSGLRVYILMYNLDQNTLFSGLIISCVVWISFKYRLDQFHVLSGSVLVSCAVWITLMYNLDLLACCMDHFLNKFHVLSGSCAARTMFMPFELSSFHSYSIHAV